MIKQALILLFDAVAISILGWLLGPGAVVQCQAGHPAIYFPRWGHIDCPTCLQKGRP